MKAISTVLQSKWRVMKIVEGLEDRFGFGGFGWFGWVGSVQLQAPTDSEPGLCCDFM